MRFLETIVLFISIMGSIDGGHRTHNTIPTPCDHNNGGCSSTCLVSANEEGYSCDCPTGVQLLSDKRTCAHEGESLLLVANGENIQKISLDTADITPEALQLYNVQWANNIDYDPVKKYIYWTDRTNIRRAHLNGKGQQDIISTDSSTFNGIAIDYLARKLYWTNSFKCSIEVSNLDGTKHQILISKGLDYPYAIIVDPEAERIYWTDRYIESVTLDGINRSVVIGTDIKKPRSLALDYERRRIYWGDKETKKIEHANLDGSDRSVLITNNVENIFSLTILGDYIYWTFYDKNLIERIHKITGDKRQVISDQIPIPFGIKAIIVHKYIDQKCTMPDAPKNGFILGNHDEISTWLGSTIEFGCDEDYEPVGERKAKCTLVNGKAAWFSPPLQCINLKYTRPIEPKYESSPSPQYIDLKYTGPTESSPPLQYIEPKCNVPNIPKNGFLRGHLSLSLGSEIQYGCDVKYKLVGEPKAKYILVDEELVLSSPPPQCIEKTCDSLLTPENGFITELSNYSVNSVAKFECQPGYNLVGKKNTTCLRIEDKLQWSNPTPECVPMNHNCKELSVDASDDIQYDLEPTDDNWDETYYPNGTRATVICAEGFEIFPLHTTITKKATTVCVNGQWGIINCTEARCSCIDLPPEMTERNRKLKYCDQFVPSGTYDKRTQCEEGFEAEGNYGARCAWGVWSIHTPLTPENQCTRRKEIKDCHLDLRGEEDLIAIYKDKVLEDHYNDFVNGSVVKFTCKTFQYTLKGDKNATCNNGQWTAKKPKCERTSTIDSLLPPFLSVYSSNFNRINTDDGRVLIPKQTKFRISCLSPERPLLKLTERSTIGNELKVIDKTDDKYSSAMFIDAAKEKMEATVECVNSLQSTSTTLDILIAATCEVNGTELNHRGLRVMPQSTQRTYVEGDVIQLECSSNKHRTNQFIMICKSSGEWTYPNIMVC